MQVTNQHRAERWEAGDPTRRFARYAPRPAAWKAAPRRGQKGAV